MNAHCTATITVVTHFNGRMDVDACTTHYSHPINLGHLRLSLSTRKEIASKLLQGVTADRIIDDIRSSVQSQFYRVHMLDKKDINNIERCFSLKSMERHVDDATSTRLWVEEIQKSDSNAVLFYKGQGESHHQIEKQHFVLCVMRTYDTNSSGDKERIWELCSAC
jgi:hypothetical protein